MRQTSAKCSLGGCEATFALTSPQITLCCRLLHWGGCFNRNPAELTECSGWLPCAARCPSSPTVQERKGRHRTVLALEDYCFGPDGASSWPGGAGMPGCRAGHLPCSDSAGRPVPGARAEVACLAGRPVLPAGRPAGVPSPTRSRERGPLRLPARSDLEPAPLPSVQPPWR